ncbi:hypothetical protein DU490_11565 [Halomonas sp. DQ26W]|uniref:helix-turn-helix domain-containing protein n=1 Tax=Halomonas sp. DQ26W TaxID=2282311 RepID=UPI000DF7BB73|nr:helix-turn-helix domain-containing protein [Halomonas sp. DQ26W]RDB42738.1 hypothetical protein DU490_11565 [Halomonas sp. DQ26W]
MSDDTDAHLKIAVALRAVRGAIGLNQAEFASLVGVSKPTIARAETMEVAMRLDSYSSILKKLREIGVKVDTLYSDSVHIEFEPQALESLMEQLADQGKRRQDRTQQGVGVHTRQGKKAQKAKDALAQLKAKLPPGEESQ